MDHATLTANGTQNYRERNPKYINHLIQDSRVLMRAFGYFDEENLVKKSWEDAILLCRWCFGVVQGIPAAAR